MAKKFNKFDKFDAVSSSFAQKRFSKYGDIDVVGAEHIVLAILKELEEIKPELEQIFTSD